jgi:hypothetical protein
VKSVIGTEHHRKVRTMLVEVGKIT